MLELELIKNARKSSDDDSYMSDDDKEIENGDAEERQIGDPFFRL